jgi:hypothetical protein
MAGPIISKLLTDFFNEIDPEQTSRSVAPFLFDAVGTMTSFWAR